MKIADQLVQLFMEGEFDTTVLTRESFPVNMRLYKSNPSYRKVILEIVRVMDEHLHSHFEDYADPRGVAAANLGFPFRIIGFRMKPNQNQFCLNPKIVHKSPHTVQTQTNCGSLRLAEPVTVERYATIDLEYYDLEGNSVTRRSIARHEGGFTIQHEVEQVNGRVICHNKVKPTTPDGAI